MYNTQLSLQAMSCQVDGCNGTNVSTDVWYKCNEEHTFCYYHQNRNYCPLHSNYAHRECDVRTCMTTTNCITGAWYTCNWDHFFCYYHRNRDYCPIHTKYKRKS